MGFGAAAVGTALGCVFETTAAVCALADADAVGVGVFVFCIVFPMVDAALLGREQNHWMPPKGRSIHIQWLDHRIERKH